MGTKDECQYAVDCLKEKIVILEASNFYPNRGDSLIGRVYLEVRM
jgi:hypothetical protein